MSLLTRALTYEGITRLGRLSLRRAAADEGDDARAKKIFAQAKTRGSEYNEHLGGLSKQATLAYQNAPIRFATVQEISTKQGAPPQMTLDLEQATNEDKVLWLLGMSMKVLAEFEAELTRLTDKFNSSSESMATMTTAFDLDEDTVCACTGISSETFQKMGYLDLRTEVHKPSLQVDPGNPAILASLKIGPLKSFERASQKNVRTLYDLNRATVQFHNPLALALFYVVLCTRECFSVEEIRNFHDPKVNKDGRPPCVHLILGWKGTAYKVEVMLMLKAFVEFKKAQHRAYDLTRAQSYEQLLADIGPPRDLEGTSRSVRGSPVRTSDVFLAFGSKGR